MERPFRSHRCLPYSQEAVSNCAKILATLHGSGLQAAQQRPFAAEVSSLGEEIAVVQNVFPELGDQLQSWLEQMIDLEHTLPPMSPCFSHGDFTSAQMIFDGSKAGLVDFDTVCMAEPALDLGQFLTYQRSNIQKGIGLEHSDRIALVNELAELFLDTYTQNIPTSVADPHLLQARIPVYEVTSLLHLALHSWQKFKGSRLKLALELIHERISRIQ